MFSITNFFWGLALVAAGVVTLKYNFQLVNTIGRQDWIESKMGGGSTFFAFKLLSVVLVLAGILFMTGFGGSFFGWLLSPLSHIFTNVSPQ